MLYLSEKAPAKINLTLDAKFKRTDGYHELEMVMTTIDLYDRIDLMFRSENKVSLMSDSGILPQAEKNLAYKAAMLLKQKMNIKYGVHIQIQKNIPVAAGLAGGSSDAAATLRGLNRLWDLRLTDQALAEIGAEIGSDVPFCVHADTALAKGRGEKLISLPAPPPCWVVLAKPTHGVSTAEIFDHLKVEQIASHPATDEMIYALQSYDYDKMCKYLGNVLEPVTMEIYPEVKRIKDKMKQFGADSVLMSGSGPTVFALVQYENQAKRLVNSLRGFCNHVYAVRMLGKRRDQVLD
ncbi:4-(cytidine 5'-diphospho)-2-C-methyl-D-erythritol kinase [Hazenella sp. IB182357]|uniref:4-diphosphocytidyl-2-C-methyl-D-erythritol kinase n=1 Tax=Polycladospora coralii TaxID=2771432 RepID=A0A926NBT2_9BACL|nr:4-(cytidine 5'-diphospho)-2-C-methyl-D-erythritol kinase [Polycladospora coralii]MBD1372470.1 4-(cytidine 5'-diphospho)-2-C-methyl-D-erythritol kinase [Polycladospora coralii]MBS7531792.1 4-(cytidine 5'-diphospho)-2-C-methyl-D-erythritol kinase [Polycladospora coralii]